MNSYFKVLESPQEVVPVKEILIPAPPEIETPSTKGIIHSIIPSFIYLTNAYYVHGAGELGNNKQRQDLIPFFKTLYLIQFLKEAPL